MLSSVCKVIWKRGFRGISAFWGPFGPSGGRFGSSAAKFCNFWAFCETISPFGANFGASGQFLTFRAANLNRDIWEEKRRVWVLFSNFGTNLCLTGIWEGGIYMWRGQGCDWFFPRSETLKAMGLRRGDPKSEDPFPTNALCAS